MMSRRPSPRSAWEELSERVGINVKPGRGISNRLLRRLTTLACTDSFRSVFSADCIPTARLARRGKFCIIVNLQPRLAGPPAAASHGAGHFVAIVVDRHRVRYLDPYGLPCQQTQVLTFLKQVGRVGGRQVHFNRRQIQSFDSVYCSLYALLFCLYFDPGRKDRPKFKLEFYDDEDELLRNDEKCVRYIKDLI